MGSNDLSAVLEYKHKSKRNEHACLTDASKVDDAIASGTKEQRRIQPALTFSKRASDQWRGTAQMHARVISAGFKSGDV